MKFKRKLKPYIRIVRRFAFFPVTIRYEIVWLESYYILQKRETIYSGYINLGYYTKDYYNQFGPDYIKENYVS